MADEDLAALTAAALLFGAAPAHANAKESDNVLRARSTGVGGWEQFIVYCSEELDRYALQSTLNGLFVTMENSYTGSLQYALRARSAEITGSWEEFVLYSLGA